MRSDLVKEGGVGRGHRALEILAGVIWLIVGLNLCRRGINMLFVLARLEDPPATWLKIGICLALALPLGYLKGKYVLSSSARKNRRRIVALERPRFWNVFSRNMALAILLMIAFGKSITTAAEAGYLGGHAPVGGIYLGIGSALLASAIAYVRKTPATIVTRHETAPAGEPPPIGVLLSNLGTPDAPDKRSVKRYLRQFLGDVRVIELPPALWRTILELLVLPRRSPAAAEAYAKVWMDGGSPLAHYTHECAAALKKHLGADYRVVVGMRYGKPGLRAALDELAAAGCEEIRVLPLFPQFSNTTTGTLQAELARLAFAGRKQPALNILPPYYAHPLYIAAHARHAREVLAREQAEPGFYVFSFHGLPEAYVRAGDPYLDHCTQTAFALAAELGLERDAWEMAFQSKFGDEPWLQPGLSDSIDGWAREHPRIAILTPGFLADCLETLEEIGLRAREQFLAAGGLECTVVPAINDHPQWIEALGTLIRGQGTDSIARPT